MVNFFGQNADLISGRDCTWKWPMERQPGVGQRPLPPGLEAAARAPKWDTSSGAEEEKQKC